MTHSSYLRDHRHGGHFQNLGTFEIELELEVELLTQYFETLKKLQEVHRVVSAMSI